MNSYLGEYSQGARLKRENVTFETYFVKWFIAEQIIESLNWGKSAITAWMPHNLFLEKPKNCYSCVYIDNQTGNWTQRTHENISWNKDVASLSC